VKCDYFGAQGGWRLYVQKDVISLHVLCISEIEEQVARNMVDDILFQTLTTFAYVGISFGNMNPVSSDQLTCLPKNNSNYQVGSQYWYYS
jgi:hypothetical protein